jgi:3-oxoisoapionate kinase
VHLARQLPHSAIRSLNLPTLLQEPELLLHAYDDLLRDGPGPIVFDAVQDSDLLTVGRLLWEHRQGEVDFVMGSGGLSLALASAYAETVGSSVRPMDLTWQPVDRMLALSGSCAPGTGAQIEAALTAGWKGVRIDAARPDVARVTSDVLHGLERGQSVVVYSAIGHADRERVEPGKLGAALARIIEKAVGQAGVRRLLVAGGDTSGYVVRSLPINVLQIGTTPEVLLSLCTIASDEGWLDGVEIVLKGGQVGRADLFERTKSGQMRGSDSRAAPSGEPPGLSSEHRPALRRRGQR